MTARHSRIRRARLRAIAVAGIVGAAWFTGVMAARGALPGDDLAGIRGARDRVGAPDLITTFPVAMGADAVLTSVLAPALAALPVGMHEVVRGIGRGMAREARLSFSF